METYDYVNPSVELYANRVINVFGTVDMRLAEHVVAQALVLEARDGEKPVTLHVMGPGGDVHSGLAIIDVMRKISCPVRTVAMGLVASMSANIAICAATPGSRYALENTEYLLHQVMTSIAGQQSDIQVAAEHMARLRGRLDDMLAAASGVETEHMHALTERDAWLDTQQALEAGIVDEVLPRGSSSTTQGEEA